jgi:dihydroorotate dehydrogenase (NAD+) catalytic subunit
MFELAPDHKYGLSLKSPVMPASGAAGYGDEYADLINYNLLGALVTNPVSLRPRKAARGTRLRIHDNHLVVHTGLPNAGIKAVIQKYRSVWERLPTPVIVHLIATTPQETARAAVYLANIPGVLGIEIGLNDRVKSNRAIHLVNAAAEGDLPVIVRIPFGRVDELAPLLVEEGASALTLTAPPRVVLPPEQETPNENLRLYRGRMYGPAVYPMLLEILTRWGRKLPVPIIACGGIQSSQQALTCLNLGATAVQIDAVLWRQPTIMETIIVELPDLVTTLINENTLKEEHNEDKGMESRGDDTRDFIISS